MKHLLAIITIFLCASLWAGTIILKWQYPYNQSNIVFQVFESTNAQYATAHIGTTGLAANNSWPTNFINFLYVTNTTNTLIILPRPNGITGYKLCAYDTVKKTNSTFATVK